MKHTIIASDNGLSPVRCQGIIWTNAAILSITPPGTYLGDILYKIRKFTLREMHLKMSSAKWRPFCLGLNVLTADIDGRMFIFPPRLFFQNWLLNILAYLFLRTGIVGLLSPDIRPECQRLSTFFDLNRGCASGVGRGISYNEIICGKLIFDLFYIAQTTDK